MNERELARRRRCRVLPLAIVLGIFLPILQPGWITAVTAIVGIVLLLVVFWRECRSEAGDPSAQ
jgi:hypothetical protein